MISQKVDTPVIASLSLNPLHNGFRWMKRACQLRRRPSPNYSTTSTLLILWRETLTQQIMSSKYYSLSLSRFLVIWKFQKLLSIEFEIDELERERFKLKRQLQIVSKKVSSLITQKSLMFNAQVENYSLIQSEANVIAEILGSIRRYMKF